MAKNVLIVESPTKEKTIKKYLPKDFIVASSYGHVRDLPAKTLGVKIDADFRPEYVWLPKAKKNVAHLKKLVAKASAVYLATDFDREGEAIAWHIADGLGIPEDRIKRITFHEITKEAILGALKKPRAIDAALVDAQAARRILDRLVGYKLSPLLWKKIAGGLSAGRVQSVALRLIVEREVEIAAFKSSDYWTIKAVLKSSDPSAAPRTFDVNLTKIDGEKIEKETTYKLFAGPYKIKTTVLNDESVLDGHIAKIAASPFVVSAVDKKRQERRAAPPYATSTLQQDASRRLGFYAKKTMSVAQSLYEGVDIGGETVGLITYMRTDSLNVAAAARAEAREYITKNFGGKYAPASGNIYKTKSKGAQEAHEAIRPTSIKRSPEVVGKHLSREQNLLYSLIWKRFAASQMSPAAFDVASADLRAGAYEFRAVGRTMLFDGWMKVYDNSDENYSELPPLAQGDSCALVSPPSAEKHSATPPPRYNEASLIKTLEEYGIGRPSTYASIIYTIMQRRYVELQDRRFTPTEIGALVTEFLKKHFADIVDLAFTASAEEGLDEIAEGKKPWKDLIRNFWGKFADQIKQADVTVLTDENCPECSAPLAERASRYGRFLACSAFPKCRYIKRVKPAPKAPPVPTGENCPECGASMVERTGRYGKFAACSAFPKCRHIKKENKPFGKFRRFKRKGSSDKSTFSEPVVSE